MKFKARWYQDGAREAVTRYLHEKDGHPLVVAVTGAGKAFCICDLIQSQIKAIPDIRIINLTHVAELVGQNYATMMNTWPMAPAGIYSAGLGKRNTTAQILFASIQSVASRVEELGTFDIIIVDEAHRIPRDAQTMYGKFIEDMKEKAPWLRVIGFTGTPWRDSGVHLCKGDDAIFTEVVYDIGAATLVEDGWLTPLASKPTDIMLDVSGVQRRGGDFVQKQLQEAVDKDEITEAAVSEIVAFAEAKDLQSWAIFCAGVDHSFHVDERLKDLGIESRVITGSTPKTERAQSIAAFKSKEITALISVETMTTGFDAPNIDLIAMLRPTQSLTLYQQIAGRGTRVVWPRGFDPNEATAEERREAIKNGPKPVTWVLDFAGNIDRHGPIDDPVEPKEPGARRGGDGGGDDEPKFKICPTCETRVSRPTKECPDCGHEWPIDFKVRHEATATTKAIMRGEEVVKSPVRQYDVKSIQAEIWRKPGKEPSLALTFEIDSKKQSAVRTWFPFNGTTISFPKAKKLWSKITDNKEIPGNAFLALDILLDSLVDISSAWIDTSEKYWSVRDVTIHEDAGWRKTAVYYKCKGCSTIYPMGDECRTCETESSKGEPQWNSMQSYLDDEIPF